MKRRVLFLCTGNSARSQMAEGLVRHLMGERWEPFSAGTQPASAIHPLAVRAMTEIGIDISAQRPKSVQAFWGQAFDLVVTVCGDAARNCPAWLGKGKVVHVGFPDPAAATGSEAERLAVFRQVRDGLRERLPVELARSGGEGLSTDSGNELNGLSGSQAVVSVQFVPKIR